MNKSIKYKANSKNYFDFFIKDLQLTEAKFSLPWTKSDPLTTSLADYLIWAP